MVHNINISDTFGRFTVVSKVTNTSKSNRALCYLCRCSCGTEKIIRADNLKSAKTRSCGCIRKQELTKHGLSRSTEYNSWHGMKERCYRATHPHYKNYGARGITVCNRWLDSIEAFIQDMGPKPSPIHSLDRIKVNGNYEPGNCRWSTPLEQAKNKRRTYYGALA